MSDMLEQYGTKSTCLEHLAASRVELLAALDAVEDGSAQPADGSWSALMVAEHVAISERLTAKVFRMLRMASEGARLPVPEVAPGRFGPGGRPLAPATVEPSGELDAQAVRAALDAARTALIDAAAWIDEGTDDAGGSAADAPRYPHPFFGPLDALGWLRMMAYHERNHVRQLQRMAAGPTAE